VSDGPGLDWGLLAAFDPDRAERVPPELARMRQLAGQSLNLAARPIERFERGPRSAPAGQGGVPQVRGWTEKIVDAAYGGGPRPAPGAGQGIIGETL
jgi:hypothetical protein